MEHVASQIRWEVVDLQEVGDKCIKPKNFDSLGLWSNTDPREFTHLMFPYGSIQLLRI